MLTAAVAEKAPEGEVKELRDVIADGERFIAELKDNLRKFKEGQQ